MRQRIPWWARIGAKLVLSRIPASYSLWQRLSLFRHGSMDRTDYAFGVFAKHFACSGLSAGQPFVGLELGPGDSLASAVLAAAHGATHTWLVDVGNFASRDLAGYRALAGDLQRRGLPSPSLDDVRDLDGLLERCHASYGVCGIDSLRTIPTASVDFIWSQAVLEHVRRAEFTEYLRETRRVLKPGGIASHEIDLRDHLGGALNNLRVSSRTWEADWMVRSGFYTNRLSQPEILAAFAAAGFAVEVTRVVRWSSLPTPPRKFAPEFRGGDTSIRLTSVFDVLARPA